MRVTERFCGAGSSVRRLKQLQRLRGFPRVWSVSYGGISLARGAVWGVGSKHPEITGDKFWCDRFLHVSSGLELEEAAARRLTFSAPTLGNASTPGPSAIASTMSAPEVADLKVSDIDSRGMVVHIRGNKGKLDSLLE